jgi:hypothetical protein
VSHHLLGRNELVREEFVQVPAVVKGKPPSLLLLNARG